MLRSKRSVDLLDLRLTCDVLYFFAAQQPITVPRQGILVRRRRSGRGLSCGQAHTQGEAPSSTRRKYAGNRYAFFFLCPQQNTPPNSSLPLPTFPHSSPPQQILLLPPQQSRIPRRKARLRQNRRPARGAMPCLQGVSSYPRLPRRIHRILFFAGSLSILEQIDANAFRTDHGPLKPTSNRLRPSRNNRSSKGTGSHTISPSSFYPRLLLSREIP